MGRKQNPLIADAFERGPKLDDNSNRYQHTCKRCGEVFPKGRVDSLTNHLLRKCPNVTPDDRQTVFQQLQLNPEKRRKQSRSGSQLSQTSNPNQSRLHTLAEVSRRQLDYSPRDGLGTQEHGNKTLAEVIAEQDFVAQLQQHNTNILLPATESIQNGGTHEKLQERPGKTNGQSVSLAQTASAANSQLEQVQVHQRHFNSFVDPRLHNASQLDYEVNTMNWSPIAMNGSQRTFGNLSMPSNEPNSGFGMLRKNSKGKTRGRFNDDRRQEVSEIRKRGACIRCRMLKKPCSGETPCNTCRNVESARLWKGTCLRTKLADELSLWAAGLHHGKAKIEVPAAVQGLKQHALHGRIDARLTRFSDLSMSFVGKVYAPSLGQTERTDDTSTRSDSVWLLGESGDSLSSKVEEYASRVTSAFVEEETRSLIKATLEQAQKLIQAEQAEQALKASDVQTTHALPTRSCYNLQDSLLKNTVELWVLNKFLTSSSCRILQLRHDSGRVPREIPEKVDWADEEHENLPKIISQTSASYRLIEAQLLAATETRCSKLSKNIVNELERRLLQRQQVSRFATFLSSVILLGCVERMTGLFRTFDWTGRDSSASPVGPPANTRFSGEQELQSTSPLNSDPPDSDEQAACPTSSGFPMAPQPDWWPLSHPPSHYYPQGPHFATLLTTLLRMRALPPKTRVDPAINTLVAVRDYSIPVHVNGRSVREQIEDQTSSVAAWLDPVGVRIEELMGTVKGEVPGAEDGIDGWEGRFVGLVLVPEGSL